MTQTVTVAFPSAKQAKEAVHRLLHDRFPAERITARGPGVNHAVKHPLDDREKETGRWGAGIGAGVGGMFAAEMSMISLSLPAGANLGHPLAFLLGGAAVGALLGAMFGGLIGIGVPEDRARRDAESAGQRRRSDIIVAVEVSTGAEAERAEADMMGVSGHFPPKILGVTAASGAATH